jgi:ABC-type sugar transport system substrate-binding protein
MRFPIKRRKKMKKVVLVMLVAFCLLFTLVSCAPATTPATSASATVAPATSAAATATPATGEVKKIKMGLAMQSLMAPAFHAWQDYLKARIDIEAKDRGYEVEFTATNADGDSTKQANDIKDLLAKGCKVIFVPCNDSQAILQSVQEVHKAGATYVSYCRAVSPDATGDQIPDVTVNFSSEEQAYVGVMEMFKIMKADGVTPTTLIDVMGQVIDENAVNREKGLRRAIADSGYADLKVVVCNSGNWEPDVARDSVDAAFQANPDANCLYTSSDFLMPGIQTAMENNKVWFPRGTKGHVYIDSSDMFPIGIELLQSKYIDTAVDQGCYQFAVNAAKSAFDILDGKTVEKMQLTLGTMATNDNISAILADKSIFLWGNDYK